LSAAMFVVAIIIYSFLLYKDKVQMLKKGGKITNEPHLHI
jgi:hypothetical protein